MSQHRPKNGQYVRRVVLPSGRAIEVVYFERLANKAPLPAAVPLRELHICPACARDPVYPVEWAETSPAQWEVALRCPNCEWSETGTFDQPTVDHFDEMLDFGTEALVEDLRRLQQANMEQEIDVFARALQAGAILPEDFQL
jgi:hypothetical protein